MTDLTLLMAEWFNLYYGVGLFLIGRPEWLTK